MKHLKDAPGESKKSEEWLDRCLVRCDEMLTLIRDWMTLSKVESGKFTKDLTKVDAKPIIVNVMRTYEGLAASKEVSLHADLSDDEYPVKADRNSLSVLFDNLVVNAINYNRPGGKVTVSARKTEDEITVSVIDTGVGISDEHRSSLFDEFFRVKGEASDGASGTGLGLPICKRIINELGGSIEVESEVGVGSTFCVRLPAFKEEGEGSTN
jgi:two-component system phosphate regulon sensor histidine kinase PhoR